jgi:uncharacterized membrane protein HdeD (DUF308 family)
LVLVLVVGFCALFGGSFEVFSAFDSGETAGQRTMFIITGLVWIAFGVVPAGSSWQTCAGLAGLLARRASYSQRQFNGDQPPHWPSG